jgi:SRSO17 transposase
LLQKGRYFMGKQTGQSLREFVRFERMGENMSLGLTKQESTSAEDWMNWYRKTGTEVFLMRANKLRKEGAC